MPVVIKSTFKPMTYDEISKPLILQTEALAAIEDAYLETSNKAALAMAAANLQTDPISYNRLKAYAEDLLYQADLLATLGLQSGSRLALLNIRNRYNEEITPIELAVVKRKQLVDEQRAAALKDLTLRFSNNFNTLSLDELVRNPNMSYLALSGELIAKSVGDIAKNYATSILNNPLLSSVMGSLYWQVRELLGYTPQLIVLEAMGDPNAPAELKAIRTSIHLLLLNNAAYNRDWVESYINLGMALAIGKTNIDYVRNLSYISPIEQERLDLERMRYQSTVYDSSHPENYTPVEGTNGRYVRHNKTKSIFDTETGEFVAENKTQFDKWKELSEELLKAEAIREASYIKYGTREDGTLQAIFYFSANRNGELVKDRGDDASSFTTNSSEEVDFYKLPVSTATKIRMRLRPLGLTEDDIIIYKDRDPFSRDEYKVLLKEELEFE